MLQLYQKLGLKYMKKISMLILGGFCWANTLVCSAIDKFEILPDLPDPLANSGTADAAQVVGNAAMPAQSVGHEPSIVSLIFSLIFVVLLIYAFAIICAKLNKLGYNTLKNQSGDFVKSHVSVVSTTHLGNNKTLHVVELDGKRMLIGASSGTIQLIKDLGSIENVDSDSEYSRIEIPNIKIPKIEIPKIEIPSIIGFTKKMGTQVHVADEDKNSTMTESMLNNVESLPNTEEVLGSLFTDIQPNLQEKDNIISSPHSVDPDDYATYKKYL